MVNNVNTTNISENINIEGFYSRAIYIQNLSNNIPFPDPANLQITFNNIQSIPSNNSVQEHILVDGPNTIVNINNINLITSLNNNGTGLKVINNSNVLIKNSLFEGLNIGFEIYNGAFADVNNCKFDSQIVDLIMYNIGNPSTLNIRNTSTTNRAESFVRIEHPLGAGNFVGVVRTAKIYVYPGAPYNVYGREYNTLTVGVHESLFTSVADAINSINPVIPSTITTGSTTITSASLFNVSLSTYIISGTGIPAGTVFTYLTPSTGTLSNPATLTGTYNLTITRATALNQWEILVSPGNYVETTITIPQFVSVIGAAVLLQQL